LLTVVCDVERLALVQLLGRGNIATCGHGTSDVRSARVNVVKYIIVKAQGCRRLLARG